MKRACLILCVLAAAAVTGCNAREVDTLWGVASVKMEGSSIIRVYDIPNDAKAEGAGMVLRSAYDQVLGELRLNEGDRFLVGDGANVSYDYKFIRLKDGFAFFRCIKRAGEPGAEGGQEETVTSLKVKPYGQPEKDQSPSVKP